jgi:hypothetical protein
MKTIRNIKLNESSSLVHLEGNSGDTLVVEYRGTKVAMLFSGGHIKLHNHTRIEAGSFTNSETRWQQVKSYFVNLYARLNAPKI